MKTFRSLLLFAAWLLCLPRSEAQQEWVWATDYASNILPPQEIGTEGAWAYGYDANAGDELSSAFEFTPFPLFGNHIWGGGDYHFDPPNPALLAKQAGGMIIHTAPNRNQPVLVRWIATRPMTINISGRAYKFAFDENNGRTQEFYIRKNAETPLTFGTVSDATLDTGAPLAFAATTTVELGDTIDTYVVKSPDKVQGFIGIELTIREVPAGAPVITLHPQPVDSMPGSQAALSVAALGNAPLAYQWHLNGNDIAGATGPAITIAAASINDAGIYGVRVSNDLGSADSLTTVVEVNPHASPNRHDLRDDFRLSSNPTDRGWQYSRAAQDGGGRVRPITLNWNEPDFGAGQIGWEGPANGPHAGWARRIENGNPTPTFDDPVDVILTHGRTSALWKSPPGDPNRFATLSGNIYNLRHLGRAGAWRILKNTTEITAGTVDDNSGDSTTPKSFIAGSGGPSVLEGIPYQPGDEFRLETLEEDFVAVNFTIETTTTPPDPLITAQPQGKIVSPGSALTLKVTATGTAPLTYQWKRNGQNLAGATSDTLAIPSLTETADYQVLVTSGKGFRLSNVATVVVLDRPTGEPWGLVADFQPNKVPAVDIGPDGAWSYGYDANTGDGFLAPFQFAPMPLYSQHVIGGADYHITAPNPGSIAPRGTGLYIHTSDQPQQQPIILRWTARRPMRVNVNGSAYKYEVENSGRTQDFFLRKNSGPLLASGTVSDETIRSSGTEIQITSENISVLPGDYIDLFVARHPGSVQGFLGVELTIAEVVSDLGLDFTLDANPTATGWQYSESIANGGGPVGAAVPNWNQPDFGANQPGWMGGRAGAHAGWARRLDNGNETPTYDDPIDTVLTHGPTSVKWMSPGNSPAGHLAIRGGFWNIRHLGRSGTWKLWKNDTQVISEGTIEDANGGSQSPKSYGSGSGGPAALVNIPYVGGDFIRLEILNNDFVAVALSISAYTVQVDAPTITLQPSSLTALVGATPVLRVEALGPPPLGYQWQKDEIDIPGATSSKLTLPSAGLATAGIYRVIVSNNGGSVTSDGAIVTVDDTYTGLGRRQSSGADGFLVLEAEHFDRTAPAGGSEWTPVANGMEATPNSGRNVNITLDASPRLDYKVAFASAGTYTVWLRGRGDGSPGPSANDSVNLGIDFSLPGSSDRITGFPDGAGLIWSKSTLDNAPATLEVASAGLHVVNIWMREDGFVLDKILITSNPSFTPTGDGPPESGLAGGVWDAYADYSESQNPNGAWQYRINEGDDALMTQNGAVTGAGVSGWQNPSQPVGNLFRGPWAVFQPNAQGGNPGLISHGPAELRWVAPGNYFVTIEGWLMQPDWEKARQMRARVQQNGNEIAVVDATPDFTLHSLDPLVMPVRQGDQISFRLKGDGPLGNNVSTFVGYNFKITGAPAGSPITAKLAADGALDLTWEGAARLEETTNLNGPWSEVNAASSPHRVSLSGSGRYFRLQQ